MNKTEVYSWRLSLPMKVALEEAAKKQRMSIAKLLESVVDEWLSEFYKTDNSHDNEEQARRHKAAAICFGAFAGGDPKRSENVRHTLRARLTKRCAR